MVNCCNIHHVRTTRVITLCMLMCVICILKIQEVSWCSTLAIYVGLTEQAWKSVTSRIFSKTTGKLKETPIKQLRRVTRRLKKYFFPSLFVKFSNHLSLFRIVWWIIGRFLFSQIIKKIIFFIGHCCCATLRYLFYFDTSDIEYWIVWVWLFLLNINRDTTRAGQQWLSFPPTINNSD